MVGSVAIRKISRLCPLSVASHPSKFATHSVPAEAEILIATEPKSPHDGTGAWLGAKKRADVMEVTVFKLICDTLTNRYN